MAKNIVLCCDGTGNEFEDNKTNPLRLHYCLRNDTDQVSFYDPGVGTFDPNGPDYSSGLLGDISSFLSTNIGGGAHGYGIVQNIEDAYRYLMATYRKNDKVYLFGFSRGAFTAQAVAGMLNKVGLLYPHNGNLVPYALRIYLKKGNPRIAREFKATMARPCKPRMIGVWDTVKSLGDNHEDDFFYRNTADNCRYGYHAVSIDERREDFVPSLWKKRKNVEQVWFPGVHSDVGGGYARDGLANAALRWMIRKAGDCGVAFQDDRVEEFVPDVTQEWNESYEGKWLVRGAERREIPDGAKVHASALERRQGRTDYDPPNLPDNHVRVTDRD